MYHFKRMVESARLNGIAIDGTTKRIFPTDAQATEAFFKAVEECQIFVFRPRPKGKTEDLPNEFQKEIWGNPFKVFSIEMAGQKRHITSSRLSDEADVSVACMMVVEMIPNKEYVIFTHAIEERLGMSRVIVTSTTLMDVTQVFIDRLNQEETGTQKIKERIKIGSGANKRTVEVRRITYVSPKRHQNDLETIYGGPVDWSHRWFVRGHWRTIPGGIGKDRSGEYCVPDSTWVKEHVKGNEDKELINKVRLV